MEAYQDLVNARRDVEKAKNAYKKVAMDIESDGRLSERLALGEALRKAEANLKDAKMKHDAALKAPKGGKKGRRTKKGGRKTRARKTRRRV